jgi:hypothetical protein
MECIFVSTADTNIHSCNSQDFSGARERNMQIRTEIYDNIKKEQHMHTGKRPLMEPILVFS